MIEPRLVILESFSAGRNPDSYIFTDLVEEVSCSAPAELLPALQRIETLVAGGLHAAGFLSYEAAPAINPELVTHPPGELPLIWFGLFRKRLPIDAGALENRGSYQLGDWQADLDQQQHAAAVAAIKGLIAAGDTYQVNLTMRLRSSFLGEPFACYRDLCRAQRAPFSAYIDTGRWQVLSTSPELFFSASKGVITTRPMKGTISRGRWSEEDRLRQEELQNSPKERAENLMIVDLLRNDLGRVAVTGSVAVPGLFNIETLPTLHQMTSTVTAELRADVGLVQLLQALFPCGSVTGAPKRRTMEIIRDLESSPRGLYTGCIGYISPPTLAKSPEAVFSVAIRTMVIDSSKRSIELGVGSGITWDSDAAAEYAECRAKARFSRWAIPDLQLIETLRYQDGSGCYLLQRHLQRLQHSAAYFAFKFDPLLAEQQLRRFVATLSGQHKVRLLLDRYGELKLSAEPFDSDPPDLVSSVAVSHLQLDSADPLRYHKTTSRELYSKALAQRPDCLDVIICNERGEACEGTNHNLVAKIGGELVTPPLDCGLLPGVLREELLARGEIVERLLRKEELHQAEELWLINSVRGWRRVMLV